MARYIDEALVNAKLKEICDNSATLYGKEYGGRAEKFARLTEDIPTADVEEVRHGHWIWLEGNLYECSECPAKTEVDEKMNEPLYQFCPYCGARMDGERK